MSAGAGRALLICNDVDAGRALGRACAERGLEPPGWCVPYAAGGPHDADVLVVVESGGDPARHLAQRLVDDANGRTVLLIDDERESRSGAGVQTIRPEPGYEGRVAERLVDLLGFSPALLPTYENRLRVLGRELDRRGIGWATIRETPGGLRVRPETPGQQDPVPFEFGHGEFRRRVREALGARGEQVWERPRSRLTSSGHERLLRAIGRDLDLRCAEQIQIVALATTLVVSGMSGASPYDPAEPFQDLLGEAELGDLLSRLRLARQPSRGWRARVARLLAGS
jgi:hypothetical protein